MVDLGILYLAMVAKKRLAFRQARSFRKDRAFPWFLHKLSRYTGPFLGQLVDPCAYTHPRTPLDRRCSACTEPCSLQLVLETPWSVLREVSGWYTLVSAKRGWYFKHFRKNLFLHLQLPRSRGTEPGPLWSFNLSTIWLKNECKKNGRLQSQPP